MRSAGAVVFLLTSGLFWSGCGQSSESATISLNPIGSSTTGQDAAVVDTGPAAPRPLDGDRKVVDVQVLSGFPARLGVDGEVRRVCGAPLPKQGGGEVNGVELTFNVVSGPLASAPCTGDRDISIKQGEMVDGTPLTLSGPGFDTVFDCVEPHGPGGLGSCPTSLKAAKVQAAKVRYEHLQDRCDPSRESTRLNLAVVVDHSGSISGQVDAKSGLEFADGGGKPAVTGKPSDPDHGRISAAITLASELNDHDRVIGYYFDEVEGVGVAVSDALACVGGDRQGKRCQSAGDCGGGGCEPSETLDNTLAKVSLAEQQLKAFAPGQIGRHLLRAGLEQRAKYDAHGRAPLWQAVDVAYAGLVKAAKTGRHIVVLADGPDTCTDGEAFRYGDGKGLCQKACAAAKVGFEQVRSTMASDGYPVTVHFIQIQAAAYRKPDAAMIEIACRSGGTYQMLNSQEMTAPEQLPAAMKRAVLRVRHAMTGTWRAMYKYKPLVPGGPIGAGTMFAIAGRLRIEAIDFPSLKVAFEQGPAGDFGVQIANEDRRLVVRLPCADNLSCGGDSPCGADRCSRDGMCHSAKAVDGQPCGASSKVCCVGTCQADCTSGCLSP